MLQKQETVHIEKVDILNKTRDMKNAGYRLVQMHALPDLTLLYHFEMNEESLVLSFSAEGSEPVESISSVFSYAFMYENEVKDLFGVDFANMNLDFNGHFYDTTIKMPFRAPESMVKDNG